MTPSPPPAPNGPPPDAAPARPASSPGDGRPVGKRERAKAANREEIRAAAIDAFTELGFGATTVRDIVRRTSLASGTFYNYYADKDAILAELVDEHVGEADARMTAARAHATTPREAIELGAAAYFALLVERPELLAMFRRNAGTMRSRAAGGPLGPVIAGLRADLERLAAGHGAQLDTELLAAGVIGAGMEIAMRFAEGGGEDPAPAVAALRALLLEGILGGPAAG
ncbi:TetR/AcrR family transcriptional regulator [Patulibacter sp. SYSU D01012]|uniref:TetR/AcrR family transcriptional regulator n=1 Tax=Patulibacter sp. SYSU D01012 TaxID=2817381 RepID=UPI001B3075E1